MTIFKNPIFIFKNPTLEWALIRDKIQNVSGVYALVNNVTGDFYIGSGVNLYNRVRDYFQPWYMETRGHLPIVRAIKKYGITNFSIVILEVTKPETAVSAEQRCLEQYKPKYNILAKAASSLGYLHTEADRKKISSVMSGKYRSEQVKLEMSKRQIGEGNTFFGKTHSEKTKELLKVAALNRVKDPVPGMSVDVLDTQTNLLTTYKSIRAVTRLFGCAIATVKKYDGVLYRDRYIITINKRNS